MTAPAFSSSFKGRLCVPDAHRTTIVVPWSQNRLCTIMPTSDALCTVIRTGSPVAIAIAIPNLVASETVIQRFMISPDPHDLDWPEFPDHRSKLTRLHQMPRPGPVPKIPGFIYHRIRFSGGSALCLCCFYHAIRPAPAKRTIIIFSKLYKSCGEREKTISS